MIVKIEIFKMFVIHPTPLKKISNQKSEILRFPHGQVPILFITRSLSVRERIINDITIVLVLEVRSAEPKLEDKYCFLNHQLAPSKKYVGKEIKIRLRLVLFCTNQLVYLNFKIVLTVLVLLPVSSFR